MGNTTLLLLACVALLTLTLTPTASASEEEAVVEPNCITLNLANIYSVLSAPFYYSPLALVPSVLADLVIISPENCANLPPTMVHLPPTMVRA